ncbi:MAG: hypothetical protein V2A34_08895 [Lentisphaerota bacterium]
MTKSIKQMICVFLMIVFVVSSTPVTCSAGDVGGGSEGAAITVGLLVAVVSVLLIIGMVSDIDYFSKAEQPQQMAGVNQVDVMPAVKTSEFSRRLARHVEAPKPAMDLVQLDGMGLRIRF